VRRRGPRFDRAVRRCGWGRSSRSRTAAATGTTAATSATRATATASATTRNSDDSEDRDSNDSDGDSGGDGELCRGDVASDVREGPHRRQQRRMAAPSSASTVRRRRDPDRVRDGPKRERGLAGATLWETLLGRRSVWGRWSFRGRGWGGWAERETLPGCRRRTVQGGECGKEHITVSSGLELHD